MGRGGIDAHQTRRKPKASVSVEVIFAVRRRRVLWASYIRNTRDTRLHTRTQQRDVYTARRGAPHARGTQTSVVYLVSTNHSANVHI
jgi:hypothetical protein